MTPVAIERTREKEKESDLTMTQRMLKTVRRRWSARLAVLMLVSALLAAAAWSEEGRAAAGPPIRPVFTQTRLDGRLIGLESDLQFGIWKPIAAAAYGLESGRIRYKAGLLLDAGLTLPVVGMRLEGLHAELVDWFSTPVLGREGRSGIEAGLTLGETRYTGFFGRLWTSESEGEAPQVFYVATEMGRTLRLPYDLTLQASSQAVMGELLASAKPFRSASYSLGLSLGSLRLTGRWGTLENEADLKDFQFTTGVRGISQTLQGHEFWSVTLERSFPMYETSWALPVPPELERFLPTSLPVSLTGAFFVQAGGTTREAETEEPADTDTDANGGSGGTSAQEQNENGSPSAAFETEALLSWGMYATLSIHQMRIRAELIITQSGETKFSVSF